MAGVRWKDSVSHPQAIQDHGTQILALVSTR